jgi:hypothetical protein
MIERICKQCGEIFWVKPSLVKNGGGKFCSSKCYHSQKFHGMFGKHHSGESIKKMSEKRKGKGCGNHHKFSSESKIRMRENHADVRGEKNPNFGKIIPEEIRKKISERTKLAMKRPEVYKKLINPDKKVLCGRCHPMFGKHPSDETRIKMSENHADISGEKNYNWKGGTSFLPYCYKFNNSRKKAVREFFNYKCICCGENHYKRELSVHHIDHDKEQGCNGKPFNLVPLCDGCHSKELAREEEYRQYINKTLIEGFKWGIWSEREYLENVMS